MKFLRCAHGANGGSGDDVVVEANEISWLAPSLNQLSILRTQQVPPRQFINYPVQISADGHVLAVRYLLEKGADIEADSRDAGTALLSMLRQK